MVGPLQTVSSGPSTAVHRELLERGGSRLTRIWAGLYTRPRMGTDSIQPSRRLPTTDYRLPTTASRAAADLAAPVLSAALLIRVAHPRHASVRSTAEFIGRHFHQSTSTCVATCPTATPRGVLRHAQLKGGKG